jgi:hypothetical protein
MKLDTRLEKLERQSGVQRYDLTCPVCGLRLMIFGDAPLDLMTAQWIIHTGSESEHFRPGAALWELAKHEHAPWQFVERRPWSTAQASRRERVRVRGG